LCDTSSPTELHRNGLAPHFHRNGFSKCGIRLKKLTTFETNPIGKTGKIKTDGFIFRHPDRYSSSFKSSFNWNTGQIKALEYNNAQKLLFAYCPDNKVSDIDDWIPVGHIIFD
jgi:hypothetical protein